jgi:hypothetical protein
MKFEKVVALVPMRHHSQRVPQKNFVIWQASRSTNIFLPPYPNAV